jgi:predicted DNA-binding transcriptional regulator AlpA
MVRAGERSSRAIERNGAQIKTMYRRHLMVRLANDQGRRVSRKRAAKEWLRDERDELPCLLSRGGFTSDMDDEAETDPHHDLISIDETARLIGVDRRTLLRWRDAGHGPSVLFVGPRVWVYRRDDVTAWIEAGSRVWEGGK